MQELELFKFAYFASYDQNIDFLAKLADPEKWDFENRGKNSILKNYLEYTFRKLQEEKKIIYTPDNKYCSFNTGLVTEKLEEIFAYFERNRFQGGEDISPYFFKAFCKKSDSQFLRNFSTSIPVRADFFKDPSALIFNPNCEIIPDVDHIISDNRSRFPINLQQTGDSNMRRQLIGSIDEVIKRVKTNYKIAVPQYFKTKTQLLLPLCLTPGSYNPDLALVIYKIDEINYCARTCLTLEMAYLNARLIVKPQSDWLKV
jgi:hypothetical protein